MDQGAVASDATSERSQQPSASLEPKALASAAAVDAASLPVWVERFKTRGARRGGGAAAQDARREVCEGGGDGYDTNFAFGAGSRIPRRHSQQLRGVRRASCPPWRLVLLLVRC